MSGGDRSYRGSPVRSKLFMGKLKPILKDKLDAAERADYEEYARDDYERTIHELKQQEGITEEDIKDYEKAAIIMKSIDYVKSRAEHQAEIRRSKGKNLSHVKSKVA